MAIAQHNPRVTCAPGFERKSNQVIETGKPYTITTVITVENGQRYEVCFDMLKGGFDQKAIQSGTVLCLSVVAAKTNSKPVNICLSDCQLMATA